MVAVEGAIRWARVSKSHACCVGIGVLEGVLAKESDACALLEREGAVLVPEQDNAAFDFLDGGSGAVVLEFLECRRIVDVGAIVALVIGGVSARPI